MTDITRDDVSRAIDYKGNLYLLAQTLEHAAWAAWEATTNDVDSGRLTEVTDRLEGYIDCTLQEVGKGLIEEELIEEELIDIAVDNPELMDYLDR